MKHKAFFLFWLALLAFVSLVVGGLALAGVSGAEVIFWTHRPIETRSGKITWILISALCFSVFSVLAIREARKDAARARSAERLFGNGQRRRESPEASQ